MMASGLITQSRHFLYMKYIRLFNKFSSNFCRTYSGPCLIKEICQALTPTLKFDGKPSFTEMSRGQVDCVGSAIITSTVLNKLIPGSSFSVIGIAHLPWLDYKKYPSRHCATLEEKENYYRIIDATPLEAYGYGRISEYLLKKDWVKRLNQFTYCKLPDVSHIKAWEKIIYPSFIKLSSREISALLKIDHYKSRSNRDKKTDLPTPKTLTTRGWKKELYLLKATAAYENKNLILTRRYYIRAVSLAPMNIKLLRQYRAFLIETGDPDLADTIKNKIETASSHLKKVQEKMIKLWSKQNDNYYRSATRELGRRLKTLLLQRV